MESPQGLAQWPQSELGPRGRSWDHNEVQRSSAAWQQALQPWVPLARPLCPHRGGFSAQHAVTGPRLARGLVLGARGCAQVSLLSSQLL